MIVEKYGAKNVHQSLGNIQKVRNLQDDYKDCVAYLQSPPTCQALLFRNSRFIRQMLGIDY